MTTMFKILSLDGGGSKGVYSLGVLHEMEARLGSPLVNHFDCFYGVSTGAIIAAGLGLGKTTGDLRKLYMEEVPHVMGAPFRYQKKRRLRKLLEREFGDKHFDAFEKYVGIVASSLDERKPKIFKSTVEAAHGRLGSFEEGSGFTIANAVLASCAAAPFFPKVKLKNDNHCMNLWDGGFCANNPTLFAIIDAVKAFHIPNEEIRVVNVGTGEFPQRTPLKHCFSGVPFLPTKDFIGNLLSLSSNTISEVARLLLNEIAIVRLSESFSHPSLKTSFLEDDADKLELLFTQGKSTFGKMEGAFEDVFFGESSSKIVHA